MKPTPYCDAERLRSWLHAGGAGAYVYVGLARLPVRRGRSGHTTRLAVIVTRHQVGKAGAAIAWDGFETTDVIVGPTPTPYRNRLRYVWYEPGEADKIKR